MFFLLRTAFWIGLVLLLLPIDTGSDESNVGGVSPVQAFFAAQSTISDLSGFCERNPETCETGGQAIARIGAKAKVSAQMIYEYLEEDETAASGGTLTAADRTPAWTGDAQTAASQGLAPQADIGVTDTGAADPGAQLATRLSARDGMAPAALPQPKPIRGNGPA